MLALAGLALAGLAQQRPEPKPTEQERPIQSAMKLLRQMEDQERAQVTLRLAREIRALPATSLYRLNFASGLANLATEGDFGRKTLEEVAETLATVLRDRPIPWHNGQPLTAYSTLAAIARYEGIAVKLDDPAYAAAWRQLEEADAARAVADFTLKDLAGKSWHLKELKGQAVLVNFWATWCPPCRKEMPDLQALYQKLQKKGLVVLALSDEDESKVRPFIEKEGYRFPVLLDAGGAAAKQFRVDGIPKNFLFDRAGRLVAQSIDMRTRKQFEAMLAKAGL